VLLLTLRGTPFLYAGEELGLEDASVPPELVVDPGGRDGCRAPIPWERDAPHGWRGAEPWLPFPGHADARSVEAERAASGSMLHLYRRLLATRKASPALQLGEQRLLDTPAGVLGYERTHPASGDRRVILVSYVAESVDVPEAGVVEVASDASGEGEPFGGTLGPERAVILRPA
jgi:alpha-glucosidase